jgi:hypothetical protein
MKTFYKRKGLKPYFYGVFLKACVLNTPILQIKNNNEAIFYPIHKNLVYASEASCIFQFLRILVLKSLLPHQILVLGKQKQENRFQ